MKTFVINSANSAKAYASSEAARQGGDGARFATEKDLERVSTDWPMLRLIAIWNKLPGVKPVRKFRDRSTALRRIWAAVQEVLRRVAMTINARLQWDDGFDGVNAVLKGVFHDY